MGQQGHGFIGENYDTDFNYCSLQNLKLYETQTRYYLIGRDNSRTVWRVLKIDRSEPSDLVIHEDPATYTEQDISDLLSRLDEGNRLCGGVNFVTKAYGLVGFIKFLKPYYMILITKRQHLGVICGHSIYGIRESKLFRVLHPSIPVDSISTSIEDRYKRLFNLIDLSKGFFYSHTYRIMWSLQRNVIAGKAETMPFDDMFVWNSFLTREFRSEVYSPQWTVALVHGFFKQVKLDSDGGKFTLTLLARRSRHFAGTRYLKRGVNAKGRVANDVETEQLVYAEKTDQICSIVQHRGSIPLFWSQETSVFMPKPAITLHKSDPTYEATKLHFQNLAARYGNPVVVLNLVKTKEHRPREVILCREYAKAVAQLNHTLSKSERIRFIQCDVHMFMKREPKDLLDVLVSIATDVVKTVGFFYSDKASENHPEIDHLIRMYAYPSRDMGSSEEDQSSANRRFQHGVLRSNCIDCLDRTNVSQYAFGYVALGQQMHTLGLCDMEEVGRDSTLAISLMELYEEMGDEVALQYGGSPAHNKVFLQWQGKSSAAIQPQAFFRSLIRHYNNAILDGEKQDAINIFLGHFRPEAGKLALRQMNTDNHLQIRRAGDNSIYDPRISFLRSISAGNLLYANGTAGASSQIAHQTSSNSTSELVGRNSFITPKKKGSTISEAELRRVLASEGVVLGENNVRSNEKREDGDVAPVSTLYSTVYRSTDSSQDPHEFTEAARLSSSGNSCDEDSPERQAVTMQGSNNSSLIGDETNMDAEDNYVHDDYFQDYSPVSDKPNLSSKLWGSGQDDDESGGGAAGATTNGLPYLDNFINWVNEGQTLCF